MNADTDSQFISQFTSCIHGIDTGSYPFAHTDLDTKNIVFIPLHHLLNILRTILCAVKFLNDIVINLSASIHTDIALDSYLARQYGSCIERIEVTASCSSRIYCGGNTGCKKIVCMYCAIGTISIYMGMKINQSRKHITSRCIYYFIAFPFIRKRNDMIIFNSNIHDLINILCRVYYMSIFNYKIKLHTFSLFFHQI